MTRWRLALAFVFVPTIVAGHPAPFSYLDVRLGAAGAECSLVLHDFDVAHDLGIDPPEALRDRNVVARYRDQLTRLMESRLSMALDGSRLRFEWIDLDTLPERQSVRLTFRVPAPRPGSAHVTAALFPYDPLHQTFVNVYEDGDLRHQAILDATRHSMDYYAGSWQGTSAVLAVFIPSGIEHILIGPDHVLFLVGLLLLGGSLWRLATIVTAFTLGHSLTLSLAALDLVSPPATLVEPAIALSIVFIGADNLLVHHDARARSQQRAVAQPMRKRPRDIRPLVAAVFGLVHGFGFASVLREFGLPLTALGWSLFGFNLGVEIGQLAIVLLVAWGLAAVRRRSEVLSRRLIVAGSLVVIAAGGYWFVERVFLGGGA